MNTNVLTIDTMGSRSIRVVPTSHKADTGRNDGPFSIMLDIMSPGVTPCDAGTPYNNHDDNQKKSIDKSSQESAHRLHERAKSKGPLEDQDRIRSEEPSPISGMNKQPVSEPAMGADDYRLSEQSGEAKGEGKAGTQFASSSNNSKAGGSPLVAGEAGESIHIGLPSPHEGQAISGSVLGDTSEGTPTAQNHSEKGENTDPISIFVQTETITSTRAQDGTQSIEGLISETTAGTSGMKGTDENKHIIADTPAAAETPARHVSSTKDLLPDGFSADDGKTETTNISFIPAQAKSFETQPYVLETDSDKRVPTDETLSEFRNLNSKESTHSSNNPSNAAGLREFNTNEFQTSTGQPESQNRSTDDNSLQTNVDQVVIQNEPPTPISQEPLTLAENAKMAQASAQASPNEGPVDVGKQILESIQSSLTHQDGEQQITIRLNPPELGKVLIRFQEQNTELTGLLEVNKLETRIEIEQALPQMIRYLADCGIQIRRLDVMLSEEERSGYGALADQSPQNNGPHEQDSAESEAWGNDSDPSEMNEWSPNYNSHQNTVLTQEALIPDGSFNILI
jgi:flagellar hook-length control protein FliK